MNITNEQFEAAEHGQPVVIETEGKEFILLSRDRYDRMKNLISEEDEWSDEELSRLAAQTHISPKRQRGN
jgi:PHD/YefM family antitoxin component YafN of YafNO toxin-antitoxin module